MSSGHPLRFGWTFDLGEFVLAPRYPRPTVTSVLADAGFHQRAEPFGAWHMSRRVPGTEQAAAAGEAVRRLVGSGIEVRNWHAPHQRPMDVVRHYAWLTSGGPFPNAEAVARAARAEAKARLAAPLSSSDREVTEQVVRGDLRVEARRALDDTEWMLAAEPATGHYIELRHDLVGGSLSVVGDIPGRFADDARRGFRRLILRETRPASATRLRAAAARSRLPGARCGSASTAVPAALSPAPSHAAQRR
ncbi:hypothetical protein ACFVVU_30615 [Kitasatospora sp. NPDC057965]|uniref:hypothetical protein n=1 Tax=Kitasatospora sp. NPDC057965 TaxID=3346291 RepID=UPI0036DF47FC